MAEFLTTIATSHHIEKIIKGAENKLFLVSPYLQLSNMFFERLKDASGKGVSITLIYGKGDLKEDQMKLLGELKGLELYYCENLHAKCYMNESGMVIKSMNLYDFSEKNNREMGVLISKEKDSQVFKDAMAETKSIIDSSKRIEFSGKQYLFNKYVKNECGKGFCIRCRKRIDFDPNNPLCDICFEMWSVYENYEYIENYCHSCGIKIDTSIARPQCLDCFKDKHNSTKLTM